MNMLDGIQVWKLDNQPRCLNNVREVADFSKYFRPGFWCHARPVSEKSWKYDMLSVGRHRTKMNDFLRQSGHPVFVSFHHQGWGRA